MILVEQWDDAVSRTIDPETVASIAPKADETPNHYHPGFGRAEPWTITFKDQSTLDINGCPPSLEQFGPQP